MAHVGLHAVGAFADRLGLGDALSEVVRWKGRGVPVHDRGKVLVQSVVDARQWRRVVFGHRGASRRSGLFGSVPSDTIVARTFAEISEGDPTRVASAVAGVRARVWSRSYATPGTGEVLLDIAATLIEVHSENRDQAAPTFKCGYRFHSLLCFADATGETLAGLLRAGNAGANTVADHLRVGPGDRAAPRADRPGPPCGRRPGPGRT